VTNGIAQMLDIGARCAKS